jgi:hypothetical protein
MGRRLRCSSVTYRFRYAPSRRPIFNATICQLHMRRCTSIVFPVRALPHQPSAFSKFLPFLEDVYKNQG